MSNILIIKHGSLGDIAQISGVLQDIRIAHKISKIFILTTSPYLELLSICPYIDVVLHDKRLARWNIFYLHKLKKKLNQYNFSHVYDLQNSSRTRFYRRYLLKSPIWNSTETVLKKNEKKEDFDEESVLNRFQIQLNKAQVITKYSLIPDFSWARKNVDPIISKYFSKKYILLFPFCSAKLSHKKWPFFNDLIKIIKLNHSQFEIAVAPGPFEINDAKKIESVSVTNNGKPLNIMELADLIFKASFVIANDTGPAHMAAHLGQTGKVLFGYHTTAKKVSIETQRFKAISVKDLNLLTPEKVYLEIKEYLQLIN